MTYAVGLPCVEVLDAAELGAVGADTALVGGLPPQDT
jgi:hypothetical protein